MSRRSLKAVGFFNSVGRPESPLIETPIYHNSADGTYWYYPEESTRPVLIHPSDLLSAEAEGCLTWITPRRRVKDGVVLIAEEPADVERGADAPLLLFQYCSRRIARQHLGRLATSYLRRALPLLDAEPPRSSAGYSLVRKSFRAHPDAVELLVLPWAEARANNDKEEQDFEIHRIADRLSYLSSRFHETVPLKLTTGPPRIAESAIVDLDSLKATFQFSDTSGSVEGGLPDPVSSVLLRDLLSFCGSRTRWSVFKDIIFGLGSQVLLYEMASPKLWDIAANLHLSEQPFSLEIVELGQSFVTSGLGLARTAVQTKEPAVFDFVKALLQAVPDTCECQACIEAYHMVSNGYTVRDINAAHKCDCDACIKNWETILTPGPRDLRTDHTCGCFRCGERQILLAVG